MWRLLNCFVCSSLIILILPCTSTLTYACNADEISCKIGILFPTKWCCPNTTTCGKTKGECNQITTASPTSTSRYTSTSIFPLTTTTKTTTVSASRYTSTSSSNTDSSITSTILISLFFFCICVFSCIGFCYWAERKKSRQSDGTYSYMPPISQSRYPNQQQVVQQSQHTYQQQSGYLQPRAPSANSSVYTNTATPIYNNSEQLPPPYEAITRDTRFMHPAP